MKSILFVFLTVMIFSFGCHKTDPHEKLKIAAMDMHEFEDDFIVPGPLWKVIETIYRPMALDPTGGEGGGHGGGEGEGHGEGGGHGEGSEKKEGHEEAPILLKKRPPVEHTGFHVLLIEKTPGVLGGQNFDLHYPGGGGVLDYRGFVPETKTGTFYLSAKFDKEMDPKELHIYYLSDSKLREVDGKPMGNGCGRYLDISEYWNKSMKDEGLVLNTVESRHISITAGTFYFVTSVAGKLRMGHLTVKDSRHRELLCSTENKPFKH